MFYFFLLVTVIRVFVTITCVAFVGLKIYSTLVNWFFSPVVVVVFIVQSCPALCNPMDCSPPVSSVRGILQIRILEWYFCALLQEVEFFPTQELNPYLLHCRQAFFFTPWASWEAHAIHQPHPNATHQCSKMVKRGVCGSHSVVSSSLWPWTVVCQAPLSMESSRREYWNGLPFPSPGALPHPGMEPRSPALWADSLPAEPPGKLFSLLTKHYLKGHF